LERIDPELARIVEKLSRLRESADHDPDMLSRDYSGDVDLFRLKISAALERGRTIYQSLLDETRKRVG
jgi:hypothetical protein